MTYLKPMLSKRIKLAVISIHPAPYRDPTFEAVHKRGVINIHVLSMFGKDNGHPYWALNIPAYPNKYLGKAFWLGKLSCFHPNILPLLYKGGYDVILSPGYSHVTSLSAIMYCWISKTALIYNTDAILNRSNSATQRQIRDFILRRILNQSSVMWVPGKASRACAIHYGFASERIFEGSYNLNVEMLEKQVEISNIKRKILRDRIGIPDKSYVFLMVGNMISSRRHKLLLNAFKSLKLKYPNVFIILIGNGPERKNIEGMCMNLFNDRSIHLEDAIPFDRLSEWYTICDAYVHPGSEPYSTALAYAAIAGRPIVSADDVGAADDYVIDKETGYIVAGGDQTGMSQAMEKLCRDASQAFQMGERGRQVARRRSVKWAAEQLESAALIAANGKNI